MAQTADRMREALAPTQHPHPLLTAEEAAVRSADRYIAANHPHVAALLADGAREHTEPATIMQRAETAIRAALREQLDGTTTNFHGASDQLAEVLIDEQARHLARPEVGGFPLEEARGYEAFSLAASAMNRALAMSSNPKSTYQTLCILLAELAEEVGA